jgi:hypothetical protein
MQRSLSFMPSVIEENEEEKMDPESKDDSVE